MQLISKSFSVLTLFLLTACGQSDQRPAADLSTQNIGAGTQYGQDIDVTQNGAITVGTQYIFPVGFYYVPYGLTDATITSDLADIKNAGYNTVHYSPRDDSVSERNFLKTLLGSAASSVNMMFGPIFYHSPDDNCTYQTSNFNTTDASTSQNYLSEYQAYNSFFSYTLSDDAFQPSAAQSNCTSSNLQSRVTTLNGLMTDAPGGTPSYAQAPNIITNSSIDKKKLYYITGVSDWWNYSDRTTVQNGKIVRNPAFTSAWNYYHTLFSNANAIGLQAHSALNSGDSAVSYYFTRQGVEVAEAGEDFAAYTSAQQAALGTPLKGYSDAYYGTNARYRSVWAEPGIINEGSGTTVNKIGVEAWLSIAAGAKGILWYAYRDPTGKVDPTVLAKTKAVLTDLKSLLPGTSTELNNVFLDGTKKYAFNNSANVFGTSWEYGGKKYLLAVNASTTAVSGTDSNLIFQVSGTQLSAVPTTSTSNASTSTYKIATYTDPRGVILTGTLPAQSATLYILQ